MPAKSLDSYKGTLLAVLEQFRPKTVLEYGPGISTQIISLYPSVEFVLSIEHNENYYEIASDKGLFNVEFIYQPDLDKYPKEHGERNYDLIFIDGRNRAACLAEAAKLSGIIILHDAARSDYRDAINNYQFRLWADEGNTVVLTNDIEIAESLAVCLQPMICAEPELEHVSMAGTIL